MRAIPSLAVVVPCYNEEDVLPDTLQVLDGLLSRMESAGKIKNSSRIYFVDDGSKDRTWELLVEASRASSRVAGIKLSRNKGHQNALYAGLCYTTEDAVISIDADLQDDPDNIEAMVDQYLSGADIVYGVRNERKTDTFFKRFTAEGYYRVMRLMGVNLVFNHSDFRLMSRAAVDAFKQYSEVNLFLRGIVTQVGFPSTIVEYERKARAAGESKYPLKKMLSFAWDGITSFSTVPLRMITVLGMVSSLVTMALIVWVLAVRLATETAVPGWASILLPLLFIGSVQLLSLGVIGEYMAKLYKEAKRRPRYHIETVEEPAGTSAVSANPGQTAGADVSLQASESDRRQ